MMVYGTRKPFESLVSPTPSHPPQMLNPGDTTPGYFISTATTKEGNSKVCFKKLSKERALLTDVLCFNMFS